MSGLLTALSERGGKSRALRCPALSLPEIRLGGMLTRSGACERGPGPVLVIDEAAGTVAVNIALLHQQSVAAPRGQR